MKKTLAMIVIWSLRALAQDPISLKDAVRLALHQNKAVDASAAAQNAAESRIVEARAGALPKVQYSESWARSDNPVFVFSSLLTQHQFGNENFELGPLNRPDFLNNFQSQVTADQTIYDAGQTRHAVRSAELTKHVTGEEGRRTQMEVMAGSIRSYYDVVLSGEQLKVTSQALRSAEADLRSSASRPFGGDVDGCGCAFDPRPPGRCSRATDPAHGGSGCGPRRVQRRARAAAGSSAHFDHGAEAVGSAGACGDRSSKTTPCVTGRKLAK